MSRHPAKLRKRNIRRRQAQHRSWWRGMHTLEVSLHPERYPHNLAKPHTNEQLVEMRATLPYGLKQEEFTCHHCRALRVCPFAFDPYNTNGDCIASK